MLKIVVFDSGFGGELFADRLESEIPVVEVIRVIDWRSANQILSSPRGARKAAEKALRPYVGNVDLIVFANYLLTTTSLKYFRRKYRNQKFVGLNLRSKRLARKPTLILTTKAVSRTLAYFQFAKNLRAKTICLDTWPHLIDDGELTSEDCERDLSAALRRVDNFSPQQILLACGQFTELTPKIRQIFGHNVRIVDSFDTAIIEICRALGIRSALTAKSK